jgi:hypothetical protein
MSRALAAASNQYSLVDAAFGLTAAPLTMCAWAIHGDTSADILLRLCNSASSTTHYFSLETNSSNQVIASTRGSGTAVTSIGGTVPNTTGWHHCGGVYSSASSRLAYLNGVAGTENTGSQTPNAPNRFTVGATATGSAPWWQGNVAHVAIWNAALTAAEMEMMGVYRVSPLLVRPANLVAYWPYLGRDTSDIDIVGGTVLTTNGTASTCEPPVFWGVKTRRRWTVPDPLVPILSLPGVTEIGKTTARPRVSVTWG